MLMFLFVTSRYWIVIILIKAIPNESDTLASTIQTMSKSTNLEMLAKGLKLVVPSSVKDCRTAGARTLSKKAENDVKKTHWSFYRSILVRKTLPIVILCSVLRESFLCSLKRRIPFHLFTWLEYMKLSKAVGGVSEDWKQISQGSYCGYSS